MTQVDEKRDEIELPFGRLREDRNCIICGADDYVEKFSYTMDFLVDVRGHSREGLSKQGWRPDDTSTIVKCRSCGCCYIRDVLLPSREYNESFARRANDKEWIAQELRAIAERCTHAGYDELDFEGYLVRTLIYMASKLQKRDIKFLDFAAGSAKGSNFARALGIRDVVAYDLYWDSNHQKNLDIFNHPGIQGIFDKADLANLGPFDAVFFSPPLSMSSTPKGSCN